jgi:hypothetical protein
MTLAMRISFDLDDAQTLISKASRERIHEFSVHTRSGAVGEDERCGGTVGAIDDDPLGHGRSTSPEPQGFAERP